MVDLKARGRREGLELRLVVYNLGGGMGHCGAATSRVWARYGIEFRDFNFSKYPPHVATLGCYAWKAPIVVAEVAREKEEDRGSVVVWLDSGVALHQPLRKIRAMALEEGFASDETARSIARFSHEGTLRYFVQNFNMDPAVAAAFAAKRRENPATLDSPQGLPDALKKFTNCNGAFSAHVPGSRRFETISQRWLRCSLNKTCVCPRGSSRANHRQDQAALTLLALQDGYVCGHQGKVVSAHGMHNPDQLLEKSGALLPSSSSSRGRRGGDPFCGGGAAGPPPPPPEGVVNVLTTTTTHL